MWPDDRLRTLFGIDIPIVQAPMAGAASVEMARAVSGAGALGSLGCATHSAADLRDLLRMAQETGLAPLNVNFFVHAAPAESDAADAAWLRRLEPFYRQFGAAAPPALTAAPVEPFDDARCAAIEAHPPAVVSFHFGLPRPDLVRRIKAAGAKIVGSATTVAEACWLAARGCDAIVAQGYEAGGHRGMFLTEDVNSQIGSLALVPQIADAVSVPVIAAGGIGDGRGIAAAFALGAAGVQIGTGYLLARESAVNALYRGVLAAGPMETAITNVFSGRPARCVANRATRELGPQAADAAAFPKGFSAIAPLRTEAEAAGLVDFSPHYCGQAAPLAKAAGAADLTRALAADAQRRLAALRGRL
ncbi:MAG: nitronate monooxygenase [Rhodospirillaceae bacterium]|nr:nitronate monooxygenase [Rhodospirillaceae bacterium]